MRITRGCISGIFFAHEGDFMLKHADRTEINASHSLKEIADVTCDTANGGILVKIQKKGLPAKPGSE